MLQQQLVINNDHVYRECGELPAQVPAAYDDDLAVKLWDLSVKLLNMDKSDMHQLFRK